MIYVSDTPYEDSGALWFHVWADAPGEAHPLLWAVGRDPDEARRWDLATWEAYTVTPDQFATLVMYGVEVTDRYGPAVWCAMRDRDATRLARLLEARSRLQS
jgi:hypothetical protein